MRAQEFGLPKKKDPPERVGGVQLSQSAFLSEENVEDPAYDGAFFNDQCVPSTHQGKKFSHQTTSWWLNPFQIYARQIGS